MIPSNSVKSILSGREPWFLAFGILLNIPGLWLDIIEPDGALYATIAKHIVLHNDWTNLWGDGHDWLDKPHFPFWMAALSYKVFGINSFAYKFPAFLFWLAGIQYTFLTARDLFNRSVAWLSVILYVTALHSTLANFDVRAEPYLTTCIVAAVWHMLRASRGSSFHLLAAALFAACGVMTKGIFVLATIGGGWVIYWILTRQWDQFTNYRWWLFAAMCFTFMLPELYALYVQFDMHPEKLVFHRTNVSGLKFFFWDSQFGRFFNTGPIKGTGSPAFFLHTTLWAFLPWSAALVCGVVYLIRYDQQRFAARWIIYGGTLITFLLFSFSGFQLPHYIVILFPWFSIIAAYFLYAQRDWPGLKVLSAIQIITLLGTAAAVGWLVVITELPGGTIASGIAVAIVVVTFFIKRKDTLASLVIQGYGIAAIMYIFLFIYFYPFLLQFQAGQQLAAKIPASESQSPAGIYGALSYSFEFYAPQDVQLIPEQLPLQDFLAQKNCYLYTTKTISDSLLASGLKARVVSEAPYFHITRLKAGFLKAEMRQSAVEIRSLLYVPAESDDL